MKTKQNYLKMLLELNKNLSTNMNMINETFENGIGVPYDDMDYFTDMIKHIMLASKITSYLIESCTGVE